MKNNREVICFFGASVTAQKSGYAAILKKRMPNVFICGYGGMHLKDAGIAYIDECIKYKPTVCFVDWFSTGYIACNQNTIDYINTIIYKFTVIKCKLIFLMLPHRVPQERKEFYKFCYDYLRKNNIPVIRVDEELAYYDSDKILRDRVHTTKQGSKLYADYIEKYYQKISNEEYIFPTVEKTQYVDVKRVLVGKEFEQELRLIGNSNIICFHVLGGPHSGIWKVYDKNEVTDYCSWNRWCYYNLDMMNYPCMVDGELKIVFSQEDFDTSECKDKEIDFSKKKKKMVLHEIIYVGDSLQITNLEDGKRIKKEVYALENISARFRRIKRRLLGTYSGE